MHSIRKATLKIPSLSVLPGSPPPPSAPYTVFSKNVAPPSQAFPQDLRTWVELWLPPLGGGGGAVQNLMGALKAIHGESMRGA